MTVWEKGGDPLRTTIKNPKKKTRIHKQVTTRGTATIRDSQPKTRTGCNKGRKREATPGVEIGP